jgi:C_GCAxxG_C_C family probable redox protein
MKREKPSMSEDVIGRAKTLFDLEYNCTQVVFKLVLEQRGIILDKAADIAAGFGAGISFSGQQCGAISGAIMAIGYLLGESITDAEKQRRESYRLSRKFQRRFAERFGTIVCDELLEIDMANREEVEKANDDGVFLEKCPEYIGWVIETVLELIP